MGPSEAWNLNADCADATRRFTGVTLGMELKGALAGQPPVPWGLYIAEAPSAKVELMGVVGLDDVDGWR